MPRAGKVGVGEALDGLVFIAIARRVGVGMVEVADPGVGAELDHAEGDGGAGIGVAVGARADKGIDRIER